MTFYGWRNGVSHRRALNVREGKCALLLLLLRGSCLHTGASGVGATSQRRPVYGRETRLRCVFAHKSHFNILVAAFILLCFLFVIFDVRLWKNDIFLQIIFFLLLQIPFHHICIHSHIFVHPMICRLNVFCNFSFLQKMQHFPHKFLFFFFPQHFPLQELLSSFYDFP